MSAPTIDTDLTITVTSATTALASDGMAFQSLDARGLQSDIYQYAGECAEDAGREIRVELVNSATGRAEVVTVAADHTWSYADGVNDDSVDLVDDHTLDHVDAHEPSAPASEDVDVYDEGDLDHVEQEDGEDVHAEDRGEYPVPLPDQGGVDVDEPEGSSAPRITILSGQPRVSMPSSTSTGDGSSARSLLQRRPRRAMSQRHRTMLAGAGGAAVLMAVGIIGGVALSSSGGDSEPAAPAAASQQRLLESFSGSGPGDVTSGSGVIFAYDYSYYVSRDAKAVAGLWAPDAGVTASSLQREIDKVAKGTTHRLDIRETSDPLVYDVTLRLTPPKKEARSFHQRFQLSRLPDGQYRIASSKTLP